MTESKKQEFINRIGQANKTEMVVVVYDIAIEYMNDIIGQLDFVKSLDMARKSVQDLINALNFEMPLSYNLLSLYNYVNRLLLGAKLKSDSSLVEEAKGILSELRESFAQIALQDKSQAMTEHTEHIVAGMTYGRGVLNESIMNSSNGFTV